MSNPELSDWYKAQENLYDALRSLERSSSSLAHRVDETTVMLSKVEILTLTSTVYRLHAELLDTMDLSQEDSK